MNQAQKNLKVTISLTRGDSNMLHSLLTWVDLDGNLAPGVSRHRKLQFIIKSLVVIAQESLTKDQIATVLLYVTLEADTLEDKVLFLADQISNYFS